VGRTSEEKKMRTLRWKAQGSPQLLSEQGSAQICTEGERSGDVRNRPQFCDGFIYLTPNRLKLFAGDYKLDLSLCISNLFLQARLVSDCRITSQEKTKQGYWRNV